MDYIFLYDEENERVLVETGGVVYQLTTQELITLAVRNSLIRR